MVMSTGRSQSNAAVVAELMACIYNTVRDSKKRPAPFTGKDFLPGKPIDYGESAGVEEFAPLVGMSASEARRLIAGRTRHGDEGYSSG